MVTLWATGDVITAARLNDYNCQSISIKPSTIGASAITIRDTGDTVDKIILKEDGSAAFTGDITMTSDIYIKQGDGVAGMGWNATNSRWQFETNNSLGVLTERIGITQGVDIATIGIYNANLDMNDNNIQMGSGGLAFGGVSPISQQIYIREPSAETAAFRTDVSGDTVHRFILFADGRMEWGSGSAARDVNLYRSAADVLKTDDNFILGMSRQLSLGDFGWNFYLREADTLNLPSGTTTTSDPTATNGTCIVRTSAQASGTMWYGPYENNIKAGDYYVLYRMKVASNVSTSSVIRIDAIIRDAGGVTRTLCSRTLSPADFRASDKWQTFVLFAQDIREDDYELEIRGIGFVTGITDVYCDWVMLVPAGYLVNPFIYGDLQIQDGYSLKWSDVNLKRVGANILQTDDIFRALKLISNLDGNPAAGLEDTGQIWMRPALADATTTLRDSPPFTLTARYWDGTISVNRDAAIYHDIWATTPRSTLVFQIAGVDLFKIHDDKSIDVLGELRIGAPMDAGNNAINSVSSLRGTYGPASAIEFPAGTGGRITINTPNSVGAITERMVFQGLVDVGEIDILNANLDMNNNTINWSTYGVNLYPAGTDILQTDDNFRANEVYSNIGSRPFTRLTSDGRIIMETELADATTTLQDSKSINLIGQYWTGTASSTMYGTIFLNMLSTAPTAQLVFQIGGTDYLKIGDNGYIIPRTNPFIWGYGQGKPIEIRPDDNVTDPSYSFWLRNDGINPVIGWKVGELHIGVASVGYINLRRDTIAWGSIRPEADNLRNFGTSTYRWRDAWFGGIVTIDRGTGSTGLFSRAEGVGRLRVGAVWGNPGLYSGDDGTYNLVLGAPEGAEVILRCGPVSYFASGTAFYPGADNTYNFGSTSHRWKDGYIVNLYTGDITLDNGMVITEDSRGVIFKSPRGEELMKLDMEGNLYVKGEIRQWN